jgi:hypothetical protein
MNESYFVGLIMRLQWGTSILEQLNPTCNLQTSLHLCVYKVSLLVCVINVHMQYIYCRFHCMDVLNMK